MSNFAIEGLVSGFDTTELINAMLDRQVRGPVKQIERRIEDQSAKLQAIQTVSANVLSLEIATGSLANPNAFSGREATSSNESIVSASASSSAPVGSFSVRVDNLAKADQVSSDLFTSPTEELGLDGDFVINGKKVSVGQTDTLSTLSAKINASNAGVKANTFQIAPNQYTLVVNAQNTGTDKIEMREVGNSQILSSIGLIESDDKYDYTVNATNNGAVSSLFDSTDTFSFVDKNFTIKDAGGQDLISVNLNANTDGDGNGSLTLQEIADKINSVSSASEGILTAEVIEEEPGKERLVINGSTGIPTKFEDPDNVLFQLGVVSGVQSAGFSSSSSTIADLLNIDTTFTSTIQIQDGDGSNTISVDIDLDSDSLTSIAEKINNAADAEVGSDISAQVLTVGGVSRLEISSASGLANPSGDSIFTDSNNILKTLGIIDDQFKHFDQQGENAKFTFNGISVNRDSNVVTDLIDGVTLALNDESSTFVNVNVTEDNSNISDIIDNFVTSYNKLSEQMGELTLFDPTEGNHGVLFGDSTIRQLESSLTGAISRVIPDLPGVKVSELNDGLGIDLGKIKITDRNGASEEVDLTGVETIQDIIDILNLNTDLDIKASVNSSGTGINLQDNSGGSGQFKVEEVDNGTTAQDLGINLSIFSDNINGSRIYEGSVSSLSSIGIELGKSGNLSFDSSKLRQALDDDPDKVKNLLTATEVGFATNFQETVKQFSAFGTGLLDSRSQSIQDRIELYSDQITRYEERATRMERVLRQRFTSLEVTLSQSQQLSQLLTQKLGGQGG